MFSRHVLAFACLFALTACGAQQGGAVSSPAADAPVQATAPAQAAAPAGAGLSITDPWVKTTKEGMTAAFGVLVNDSDAEVTVVSAGSPLSPTVELHEVVESGGKMVMRAKKGGFVIPAHGTHQLEPGGDHIMLMGVTEEVKPGARIPFTLTVKDGKPLEFTAVGKDFAGGKEDYHQGMDH
ncbi:copper chaperone PCu(A)C [Nonomuraea sp. NPDC048916]|uniref:copper chaperone PCu(A)C n=1 Tax=Nonomuraea sp. NPDC048916 TaxID=3154232 RepID=UPI0033C80E5D